MLTYFLLISVTKYNQACNRGVHINCTYRSDTIFICENQIPKNVKLGVTQVILKCLDYKKELLISEGSFDGMNWNKVQKLRLINLFNSQETTNNTTLGPKCFTGLSSLTELYLNEYALRLTNLSFYGLSELKVLDLSDSRRISYEMFLSSLSSYDIMPKLTNLSLSKVSVWTDEGFSLDRKFWKVVNARPVKNLDISSLSVGVLDIDALLQNCSNLEQVNASQTQIADLHLKMSKTNTVCPRWRTLDLRSSIWPIRITSYCSLSLHNISNITLDVSNYVALSSLEWINLEGVCGKSSDPMEIVNVKNFSFKSPIPWNLKEFTLRRANIKTLDVELECTNPRLQKMIFASNSLEFVNPLAVSCMTTLQYLDLSDNMLSEMCRKHYSTFSVLFSTLINLRYISLSSNKLEMVPSKIFENNTALEVIDLSFNFLKEVNFSLKYLPNLKLLNLSYNHLVTLDSLSRSNILGHDCHVFDKVLDLSGNSFRCSKCIDFEFANWVVNHWRLFYNHPTCGSVQITEKTVEELKYLCERRIIIILSTTVPACNLALSVALVCLLRKCHRKTKMKRQREEKIRLMEEEDCKYLISILSAVETYTFVNDLVLPGLLADLKLRFNTDRDLAMAINPHEDGNCPILESSSNFIKQTDIILLIVSKDFLYDNTLNVIAEANADVKPVILLLYDIQTNNSLPPRLQLIHQKLKSNCIQYFSTDSYKPVRMKLNKLIEENIPVEHKRHCF